MEDKLGNPTLRGLIGLLGSAWTLWLLSMVNAGQLLAAYLSAAEVINGDCARTVLPAGPYKI